MYARMRSIWPVVALGCFTVAPFLAVAGEPQAPVSLPMPGTLLWANPEPTPVVVAAPEPAKPIVEPAKAVKPAPEPAKPVAETTPRPGFLARWFGHRAATTPAAPKDEMSYRTDAP